jgi:hypothetical protein
MMHDERIGNAQRAKFMELLGKATEEGYLSLDEYDQRAMAVSGARLMSELQSQTSDLPSQFHWDPRVAIGSSAPPLPHPADQNVTNFAIASLALGIASIALSACFGVGGLFGLAAIFFSIPGARGASGWSKAFVGRVLGIIGIVLSLGVVAILLLTPGGPS